MSASPQAKALLVRIRRLFDDPDRWTKGSSRRTKYNPKTDTYYTAFCLLGAITKEGVDDGLAARVAARGLIAAHMHKKFDTIPKFNDFPSTTIEQVRDVLDDAIADATARIANP